jgi:Uma2 family endonuclease
MAPQALGSGRLGGKFYRHLADYVDENQLGEVLIEVPFVLTMDRSRWVTGSRVPDVMFYTATRFKAFTEEFPDWESIPAVGAPDFVAEIVSPTDRFSDVSAKVARYLDDGVRLVWLLDREQQRIQVHIQGSNQSTVFQLDETVSADPVIPGYTLALSELLH